MKYIYLITLLFLCSCSGTNYVLSDAGIVIRTNVDAATTKTSEKTELLRIVPLETTDESLIGTIYKLVVNDSLIIIMHDYRKDNAILVFDKTGKFLRQIGRIGNGPGEYIYWNDMDVDFQQGLLYAYDGTKQSVFIYRLDGTFVEEVKSQYWFSSFRRTGVGYWIYTPTKKGYETSHALRLVDHNFKEILAEFLPQAEFFPELFQSYFFNNDQKSFFMSPFGNIIYELKGKNAIPLYVIDFKDRTLPYNDFINLTDKKEYEEYRKAGDYLGGISRMCHSDNRFYFSFYELNGNHKGYSAEYNVQQKRTITYGSYGEYHDKLLKPIEVKHLILMEPKACYRDIAVYPVDPTSLESEDIRAFSTHGYDITEESNPVLFFVKELD